MATNSNERNTWRAAGPLRQWRSSQDPVVTQGDVAGAIGITKTSVQLYEWGDMMPSAENMAALAKLTGIDDLAERWEAWHKARPQLTIAG